MKQLNRQKGKFLNAVSRCEIEYYEIDDFTLRDNCIYYSYLQQVGNIS